MKSNIFSDSDDFLVAIYGGVKKLKMKSEEIHVRSRQRRANLKLRMREVDVARIIGFCFEWSVDV